MRARTKWLFLLGLLVVLFFWKIVLTRQFSLLSDHEAANGAYCWYHFSTATIKQGVLPLWDPYTFCGRSFVAEMQTAPFYPLKLLLYLWPLNRAGLLSPQLVHWFYVLEHFLAACFMFLLAEELGLAAFPALVTSLCFTLSGFVGRVGWLQMLDAAIWLPLVLLFLLRSLRSTDHLRRILYASLAGLALGAAVLAGGMYIAMMDAVVVVGAAAYFAHTQARESGARRLWSSSWLLAALVVLVAGVVSLAAAAVQLFPSMEYAPQALRYYGEHPALPATAKVPYSYLTHNYWSRALLAFFLPNAFPGGSIGDAEFSPYFGLLPLLLVVLGIWRGWETHWVRYLTVLAGLSFFYALGTFSFLHGVAYLLVPYLWMLRASGRSIYLTHFAMALLAGFGTRALFDEGDGKSLAGLERVLKWPVIAVTVALGVPALYGKPEINEWMYFSLLFMAGAYGLFAYIFAGHRTRGARFLLVALILCELNPLHWQISNKMATRQTGTDHLEELLNCRGMADFFKSQRGLFRVHMDMDREPNLGDLFGVQTTGGLAVTALHRYEKFTDMGPRANDFLNVRFIVRRASATEANPVYSDAAWKVYANPSYLPRAWVVHRVETETSSEKTLRRVADARFDPRRMALVGVPFPATLEDAPPGSEARVAFGSYQANHFELQVHAPARGLLVLSELDYPGWRATVNGAATQIYRVDGLLRGIVVPRGDSDVRFRYAPLSVLAGAMCTAAAFLGVFVFALVLRRRGGVSAEAP